MGQGGNIESCRGIELNDCAEGRKIENNRGIEQNDGVKEERFKVTEGRGGRHYMGQIQPSLCMPPGKPFDKGPGTIHTKTNEITDPWVTYVFMYALPSVVSFPKP